MIILGIDPGTQRIGYGAIRKTKGKISFLDAGLLRIKTKDSVEALLEVKREVDRLMEQHKPSLLAVERLYFAKNQKTAIAVAHARGVILLSALEHEVPIAELSPTEIKLGLTGYGSSDKKSVLKMVRLTLGDSPIKMMDDASDALAAAIVASTTVRALSL